MGREIKNKFGEKRKLVCGIDPGLCHPAFVILDTDNKIKFVEVMNTKTKGEPRKSEILVKLKSILHTYKPFLVVLEGYSYMSMRNMKTYTEAAESVGMIKHLLYYNEIGFIIVPPATWKKFAVGKGNTPKNLIPQRVYKLYKEEFKTTDEVDAYCLARVGVGYTTRKNLKEYQEEVVKKLKLAV